MENTIKTENGIFTIKHFGEDYKIEMFEPDRISSKVLYVEYSSDFYKIGDEQKIENLFKELEPQIIQIIKFFINQNFEFYKHFDFNPDYTLVSNYANLTPTEIDKNVFFHISWDWFLNMVLKNDSLEYLKSLTDEQKRLAYGFQ